MRRRKAVKKAALIKCSPYPFRVVACVGMDWREIKRAVEKYGETEIDREYAENNFSLDDNTGGRYAAVPQDDSGYPLLFALMFPDLKTLDGATVAHECFHVLSWALPALGADLERESGNEPWAYMLSYMMEQIGEAFNAG